jgi:hypothetical protein
MTYVAYVSIIVDLAKKFVKQGMLVLRSVIFIFIHNGQHLYTKYLISESKRFKSDQNIQILLLRGIYDSSSRKKMKSFLIEYLHSYILATVEQNENER